MMWCWENLQSKTGWNGLKMYNIVYQYYTAVSETEFSVPIRTISRNVVSLW